MREKAVQDGEVLKVGVNCFKKEEEAKTIEFHAYNKQHAVKQIEKLKKTKRDRNNAEVQRTLEQLKADAGSDKNVMPAVIEAVKAYATVGEIAGALKDVYGEYDEKIYF